MDPGSVGREVKPKVRVVTIRVIMWFVVRSVMGIAVVRIVMMVSVNPVVPAVILVMVPMTSSVMSPVSSFVVVSVTSSVLFPVIILVVVPVANFVMFLMTILVMVPLTRPSLAIPCLRRRRPNDQKHCQKSDYYNLTDVFHFDPPFIRISRRGEEKGYKELSQRRRYGWVEKKRSRSSARSLKSESHWETYAASSHLSLYSGWLAKNSVCFAKKQVIRWAILSPSSSKAKCPVSRM